MELTIVNEKGLFASVNKIALITENGLQYLKNWQSTAELSPVLAKKYDDLIKILESFEVQEVYMEAGKNDTLPGQVFLNGQPTPQSLGWESISKLLKLRQFYHEVINTHELGCSYTPFEYAGTLEKRSKSWSIKVDDIVRRLGNTKSFAIYDTAASGYLNDKGYFLPLSGARMFESAESARRTCRSRNLSDVVIVEVELSVSQVVDTLNSNNLGDFYEVISAVEGDRLRKSLEKAHLDDLLEKVEKIRVEHPELFEKKAPASPKRHL